MVWLSGRYDAFHPLLQHNQDQELPLSQLEMQRKHVDENCAIFSNVVWGAFFRNSIKQAAESFVNLSFKICTRIYAAFGPWTYFSLCLLDLEWWLQIIGGCVCFIYSFTNTIFGSQNAYYSIESHGIVWYCLELNVYGIA